MRISDWSSDVCSSDLTVPVINGLTDLSHPCQIVADLLTVVEHGVALPGSQWAWLGDGKDRKSVVSGKSVSVRVDLGGRRIVKKKMKRTTYKVMSHDDIHTSSSEIYYLELIPCS